MFNISSVRSLNKLIEPSVFKSTNIKRALDKTIKICWQRSTSSLPLSNDYPKEWLIRLTKQTQIPEEKLVFDIRKSPLPTYHKFYNNQFNSINDKGIILKIIGDINSRIDSNILKGQEFDSYKKSLQIVRDMGIDLLSQSKSQTCKNDRLNFIYPPALNSFVINYIEAMYELLKSQDSNIQGNYYTNFAKDFLTNLCPPGKNSQLFFTFKDLDEQYFIDVRPLCLYPVFLMNLPEFSSKKPLIPTKDVQGHVESRLLDFREVTFHDIGHAHVMSRQDKWLFETCNSSPLTLVTEWLRNKDWYMAECNKLFHTNHTLYQAIKLYLFEVVHDRGYQFYLPILKQQFKATKNLENIKARIMRGEFDKTCDRSIVDHLDKARKWLLDITEKFMIHDNIDKIEKYKQNGGYLIKKYPDIESCMGVPTSVGIFKNGKILVNFDSNGVNKTTSLFEIELISLPVEDVILSHEKISKINEGIRILSNSNNECVQLDSDANIVNLASENLNCNNVSNHENSLKKIEIYKLERLLKLIKNNKKVKFSISKLPDVYDSSDIRVDPQKKNITIDTGLIFKLNEISIENKPRTTLKYVNLEPNDRFISDKLLKDAYIRCSHSKNFQMKPYITLNDELELGIIDTKKHTELAKAVSSVLSRSIDKAKDVYGGYLPSPIVERAQLEYVSPYAVSNLWGRSAFRFVLSRKINSVVREIIGTALITNNEDTLLFFTNKYNNLKFSTIRDDVDFNLCIDGKHKWFDKFAMPKIDDYKPIGCHQLANFAIESTNCRGVGLGKLLISEIIKNYALSYPKVNIQHSQPLICGKGLFQIADPSWKKYMLNIGFKLRQGAETFYIDREWDKLKPIMINGKEIDNKAYNRMYDMPQIYENINLDKKNTDFDLLERIPKVIELANSGNAKLQYFQMITMFDTWI